jgi:phosphohistidine phosphatase
MKRLLLLRHASASPTESSGDDHERALSRKGCEEADLVGAHLAKRSAAPSLILCSSARRAVETAERVGAALPTQPRLEVEPGLYMTGAAALLERLAQLPDAESAVLVVAHNPGIQALALRLAREGAPRQHARMASQFPAASLAILALAAPCWAELERGGRLDAFARPRDLGA